MQCHATGWAPSTLTFIDPAAPTFLLQIIVRKVYHLLAMGLFVPVFFWDLQLLALSLAVAFAVLVLLEVLRCIRVPLLGQAVQDFMQVRLAVGAAAVLQLLVFA